MTIFSDEDIKYIHTTNLNEEEKVRTMFQWGINKIGIGVISFFYKNGVLKCDNEGMSKESIKRILCKFVDNAEFIDK